MDKSSLLIMTMSEVVCIDVTVDCLKFEVRDVRLKSKLRSTCPGHMTVGPARCSIGRSRDVLSVYVFLFIHYSTSLYESCSTEHSLSDLLHDIPPVIPTN
jgi:hypothetical protein